MSTISKSDTIPNGIFAEMRTYFVQYNYFGKSCHCQIEAQSYEHCKQIFSLTFGYCYFIEKIQTVEDISNHISDTLIEAVKKQLKL